MIHPPSPQTKNSLPTRRFWWSAAITYNILIPVVSPRFEYVIVGVRGTLHTLLTSW